MNAFANWLSTTAFSQFIQRHEAWMIPTIQSFHIIGIGLALGSALMITMRLLGWMCMDQTLLENHRRFGPWLTGALCLLFASGLLLIIAEPVRELITVSFWVKMAFVATLVGIAVTFHYSLRRDTAHWEQTHHRVASVRLTAIITLIFWCCIIVLGRLIAYDHIWGHLSPATKA